MSKNKKAEAAGLTAGSATVAGIGAAASGASAATITGTLATVGSAVGGGMMAGLVLTAAAPLVAGGAVYGLVKWLSSDD